MWFAGLGTENWINPKGLTADMYAANAQQLLNHPIEALKLAVHNFHRHFLWVGLLEYYEDSMELFRYQTNLTLPSDVSQRRENFDPTEVQVKANDVERLALKTAYPMDVALYAYIKEVQMARMKKLQEAVMRGLDVDVLFCKNRKEWEESIAYPFHFNGTAIWPPEE